MTVGRYGLVAGVVRISDKLERIENLLAGSDRQVDDETLLDSIGDMATYCVMMAAECMATAMNVPDTEAPTDNKILVKLLFDTLTNEIDRLAFPVPLPVDDAKFLFYRMELTALSQKISEQTRYSGTYQYARMLAAHMLRWYAYGAAQ